MTLFSVLLVTVLLILSMIVFARRVQRLNDLQITNVLHFIGQQGRAVVRELFPRLDAPAGVASGSWSTAAAEARQCPVTQTLRDAGEPMIIACFQIGNPGSPSSGGGCRDRDGMRRRRCPGRRHAVVADARQLATTGGGAAPASDSGGAGTHLRARPQYTPRLLVDIAIKALSPAINDPTTAVQAIDQIEDLLHRLGRRALDAGCVADEQGVLRLIFPTPTWEDYLTLAFDEIRQFGASSIQVMRRLRAALLSLMDSVTEVERKERVRRYVHHLNLTVEHSMLDAEDQVVALQEDRQGLGLSRRRAETERDAIPSP